MIDDGLTLTAGRPERFAQRLAWLLIEWLTRFPLTDRTEWWIEALSRFATTGSVDDAA
jgi:hypothetical protein